MNNKLIISSLLCGLLSASSMMFGMHNPWQDTILSAMPTSQSSSNSPVSSPSISPTNNSPRGNNTSNTNQANTLQKLSLHIYDKPENCWFDLDEIGNLLPANKSYNKPVAPERDIILNCTATNHSLTKNTAQTNGFTKSIPHINDKQVARLQKCLENKLSIYAWIEDKNPMRITTVLAQQLNTKLDDNPQCNTQQTEKSKKLKDLENKKSFISNHPYITTGIILTILTALIAILHQYNQLPDNIADLINTLLS